VGKTLASKYKNIVTFPAAWVIIGITARRRKNEEYERPKGV
jgi:hypothetical protein